MSPIKASLEDNVLRITLADPASGNLLDDAMLEALLAAMEQWPEACVMVLDAEGPDFSVGRPRPRASSGLEDAAAARVRGALQMVHTLNMKLRTWPGASLVVLRGKANGAAAGFIANADIVIAETGSRLGFAEITYDLPPALVASYLPNRTIPRAAHYLLLTGAEIGVERARAWGLVHEVHAGRDLAGRRDELIEFLASRAPGAVDHCKRSLDSFRYQEHAVAGPRGIDRVLAWLGRKTGE